jgi:hypothetical protein
MYTNNIVINNQMQTINNNVLRGDGAKSPVWKMFCDIHFISPWGQNVLDITASGLPNIEITLYNYSF